MLKHFSLAYLRPKTLHNFGYYYFLFINFGLTNLIGEKLVLHGFYKPHSIKAVLQKLIYAFILAIEEAPRKWDEVILM